MNKIIALAATLSLVLSLGMASAVADDSSNEVKDEASTSKNPITGSVTAKRKHKRMIKNPDGSKMERTHESTTKVDKDGDTTTTTKSTTSH